MSLGPVMLDISGVELARDEKTRLLHPLVGGVILFARNFSSSQQLTTLTAEIHALRTPHLLIAVDQEGGRVQRFQEGFTRLPAMRELGKVWDKNPNRAKRLARQVGLVLASELAACGIDVSFTPVIDVDHGKSSVIRDRAFHYQPQAVASLARSLMMGMKLVDMMAVGKHFPGHGYTRSDTHTALAVDDRPYVDIELDDLAPFRKMVDFGLSGMMAAHVVYPQVDKHPAGFSRAWLKDILRGILEFEGCIFSDDLSMHGIDHIGSMLARAQAALSAGCDMVLVCNNSQGVDELLQQLQWDISAVSMARIARMHGSRHADSMMKLREKTEYIHAVLEISKLAQIT